MRHYQFISALLAFTLTAPVAIAAIEGGGQVANAGVTIGDLQTRIETGGGCPSDAIADRVGLDFILIEGSVFDANGESDVTSVKIVVGGVANATYSISTSSTRWDVGSGTVDTTPDASTDSASPDYRSTKRVNVWDDSGSAADGTFRFNAVLPVTSASPLGTWSVLATATDEGSQAADVQADPVLVGTTRVLVDASPVASNGTIVTGRWGGWSAVPDQTNVASANFLRIRNVGDCPDPEVLLSWDAPTFTAVGQPSLQLPLAGNIRYAVSEADAGLPPSSAPAPSTQDGAPVDGSATFGFNRTDSDLLVAYQLVRIPAVARDLVYRQGMTVTCLTAGCETT